MLLYPLKDRGTPFLVELAVRYFPATEKKIRHSFVAGFVVKKSIWDEAADVSYSSKIYAKFSISKRDNTYWDVCPTVKSAYSLTSAL